jgi:tetratricopeptide (TPR) repeat protein
MSKNAELSRKDMKEPDQFQAAAGEAASWLTGHRRQSTLIAGAAVAVLVAALVVSWLRDRSAQAAGAALSAVYKAAGAELSPVPLPGVSGPFFASDAERQKAVVDAAAKALADHGSSRAGALAALAKGDAHLKLGEWDAAAAAYQAYLATAPKDDALRFGALEGLALVEEGKGNGEAALAAYARLAAEVPGLADRADLAKARLLAAAGKKDEARQLLAGFGEAHKGSALAGEASERLAKLGAK